MDTNRRDNSREALFSAVRLVGVVGLVVVGSITAFFLTGLYVSRRFPFLGMAPPIIGVLLGVALSFYWVYRALSREVMPSDPTAPVADEPPDPPGPPGSA